MDVSSDGINFKIGTTFKTDITLKTIYTFVSRPASWLLWLIWPKWFILMQQYRFLIIFSDIFNIPMDSFFL